MEMKLIQKVMETLDDNGFMCKIENEDGVFFFVVVVPSQDKDMPATTVTGRADDIIGGLKWIVKHSPEVAAVIGKDLIADLNSPDLANPAWEGSDPDALSIANPYLAELRFAFDKAIQSAADAVDMDSTATVTAKLVLNEDPETPEFANGAKVFQRAKFDVGVNIKREVNKYIGSVNPFGTKIVDGKMVLFNPDRQIELDEIIKAAEAEVGNVPPEEDLMADAPVDPSQVPMSFDA